VDKVNTLCLRILCTHLKAMKWPQFGSNTRIWYARCLRVPIPLHSTRTAQYKTTQYWLHPLSFQAGPPLLSDDPGSTYIERVTPFDYRLFLLSTPKSLCVNSSHFTCNIYQICICQRFILGGYVNLTIEIRMIGRLLESNTQ